jgi:hypothetical protein
MVAAQLSGRALARHRLLGTHPNAPLTWYYLLQRRIFRAYRDSRFGSFTHLQTHLLQAKGLSMHHSFISSRFLSITFAFLTALLIAYSILVLYPAYQSGLATVPDPTADTLTLPLYTAQSADHAPLVSRMFVFGFFAFFWCALPICSLVLLTAVVIPHTFVSQRRRRHLAIWLCLCWSVILFTLPGANAFFLWLMD